MNVFDLQAVLSLDSSPYEKGLSDAETKGSSFGKGLATAAKVGAGAVVAAGGAAIGAGVAFVKGAGDIAEYGDNIDKMSQKIGISAEAYQEWDAVLQHSGASVDSLRAVMKTLSNQAQKNAEEFAKLGISEEEVATLSQEDLFSKVVSGLQQMEASTERTAIASKLLGRGATELGALLNTSAEETQAMKDRVHELGGVMSNEAVKSAAEYQDTLQDMTTSLEGMKRNLMSDFLPGISSVMKGLTAIFSGNMEEGSEIIEKGIDDLITGFTEKLPKILDTVTKILNALIKAITKNLPAIIKAGTDMIINLVKGLIDNLPAITKAAMDAVITFAKGIAEALPELIPAIVEMITQVAKIIVENLPLLLEAALQVMQGLAQGILDALPILIEALPVIIQGIVDFIVGAIPMIIEAGIQLFLGLVEALPEIIAGIVEAIPKIIDAIVHGFVDNIDKIIDAGVQLFVALVENLPLIVTEIVKAIPVIVEAIVNGFGELAWKIVEVGENLIKGIWEGITNFGGWLWDNISGFFSDIWNGILDFFGIHSPSKKGEYLTEMLLTGMGNEFSRSGRQVIDAAEKLNEDVLGAFDTDVPLDYTANVSGMVSDVQGSVADGYSNGRTEKDILTVIADTVVRYLPEILAKQLIVDEGSLNRGLAPGMDKELGMMAYYQGREVMA